jgi:hypothetical protein
LQLLIVLGRREPSPFSLGDIGETLESALFGHAENLRREDVS